MSDAKAGDQPRPLSKDELQTYLDNSPFIHFLGLKVTEADPANEQVTMSCAMKPEFERGPGSGMWHGGPIAAIIDTVGDYALIMALRRGLPTINFRVDYLRPAIKTGLLTTARVRRAGKSVGVVDVDVFNDHKALVAVGRAPNDGMEIASQSRGWERLMSSVTRRTFTAGALAGGLAVPLGAAVAQEADPKARRGGTLVATWGGGEPQACYVPSGGGSSPTFSSTKLFERLGQHRTDGSFAGELAEGWKPASDFKSYTIKVRKGVKFHDGKDMTADDVVYSIDEIWKKYSSAAALSDYAGAVAPDAETVVVTFSKPVPEFFFSSMVSGGVNFVVPKHVYAGSDPVTNPANNAPIGTGPWKYREWVRGSHIEYARNEAYWRPGFPYLDRLILRYVRDPAGRAAAMEAGEIQIGVFNPVSPPDIKRLVATGKFVATPKGYEESVWSTTLECNLRNPIFDKREVRQAMFNAIDRSIVAKTVYYGFARVGTSPIFSPNKEFYTADIFTTGFDPKKAAALLDAAGYPKKADGKRFTLNLLAAGWFPENGKVGAYVKQALEDVGVGITLSVPDRPTSIKRIYTDYDFDLAISNQSNPSEPVPATTQYYTSDGIKKGVPFRNASGFHSDEIDQLVDRIKVETDPARRREMVFAFQKLVTREANNLPLVELESTTVASTRVQNHSNTPDYLSASWYDIWMES